MKIRFILIILILFSVIYSQVGVSGIKLKKMNGKTVKLSSYLSKGPVLINFWATDCPGCIKEMPDLIETYNTNKHRNFEILAVSMYYDPPSRVMTYVKNNPLPFPVIMDIKKDVIKHFENVKLTPTSILINHEGKIVNTIIGEIEFKQFNKALDSLLLEASQHSL